MAYSNLPIGTSNPTLIMILIDQSQSMEDPYGGKKKADVAALAVNRVIYEILLACQSGSKIKDRCFVGVIGYGASIEVAVGGMISEIADKPIETKKLRKKEPDGAGGLVEVEIEMPIWLRSTAENGTPMAEAFENAYEVVVEWINNNPSNFPPVVINITDGVPNDANQNFTLTEAAANKLMNLSTNDGNVLVLNAHISNSSQAEVRLPNGDTGLYDQYAKFLFRISSVLPGPLFNAAQQVGFSPQQGARGFVFNAGPETMIKLLNFGSLGTLR